MKSTDLRGILEAHQRWLDDESSGVRADLHEADLRMASLRMADLCLADLHGADLRMADLHGANLHTANLHTANLHEANLRTADLHTANLRMANLHGADLHTANLHGAKLTGSVLDPDNTPNADVVGFEQSGDHVIGYRTREAGHIDKYRDGRTYAADWFSTCVTECHPGLYLWPTLEAAQEWSPGKELIKVETSPADIHHAGTKWRCRWFRVVGCAV